MSAYLPNADMVGTGKLSLLLIGPEEVRRKSIARVVAGLGFAFGGGQIFTDDVLMVMGSAKLVAD